MERLKEFLEKRRESGTLRTLLPVKRLGRGRLLCTGPGGPEEYLDFSSNDYLALSEHPSVIEQSRQCLDKTGAGAGAARLMSGDYELQHRLEEETASLKNKEASLVFGSGYLANAGIVPALVGRDDVIFSDRLNHASIIDGCLLSGARLFRFRHNDLNHLEELLVAQRGGFRRALIVVESIYSMDGDRCPLAELATLKNRFDCLLMVDEAHATGVYGENGGGVIEEDGVGDDVDLAMGTFGKALGSYGAYVACSRDLVDYLVNSARTFIYSTALPPAVIGASLAAVQLVKTRPELRLELHAKVTLFKQELSRLGFAGLGPSQIIPIVIGESSTAVDMATALRKAGIFATAVRPPTVPEGSARLRLSITRHHQESDLVRVAELLVEIFQPGKEG